MTVTPYGGEQHVFHIPAGESSSLRLSHSLPPWCHNLFWCLWHLDYFWCEGAACVSYISLCTIHYMFNVCHLIVSLSHLSPPLSPMCDSAFLTFCFPLSSLSSCSSNFCTCLEEMRRKMHCCYATTSSTVGGGPGWCLDMPFLKVYNFSLYCSSLICLPSTVTEILRLI